jgi:hypothetical protein
MLALACSSSCSYFQPLRARSVLKDLLSTSKGALRRLSKTAAAPAVQVARLLDGQPGAKEVGALSPHVALPHP